MEDVKEFYTINEFAKKLRVCPNTIRKGIKRGRIQYTRTSDGPRAAYRIPAIELHRICEKDMMRMIEDAAERIYELKMEKKQ